MAIRERLSGNEAVSFAVKQINPDVMPAFPITPSTEIPQYVAQYVANGEVDTVFVPVESEHSSMSATIAASAAGARAFTATSSCGLALMHEVLYIGASNRAPVVLALVCRALSGPININGDHSDGMGSRDSGWLQIYAENNQEAYDNFLQAYRISEHEKVQLPIMICQDGFITSHAVENILLVEDDAVKEFVGAYTPENYLLNKENPLSVGAYATTHYYMEAKRRQAQAMVDSKEVILEVAKEFEKISGRSYGLFEEYCMEDAEQAIVIMGSAAGTAKDAIDALRADGHKVGMVKVRVYRPFPAAEIAEALSKVKTIAVMDRADSFSSQGGPLAADVRSALFDIKCTPDLVPYVYGLGGRDVKVDDIKSVFQSLIDGDTKCTDMPYRYLGVRE